MQNCDQETFLTKGIKTQNVNFEVSLKKRSLFSNFIELIKNKLFPASNPEPSINTEELQANAKKTLVKLLNVKAALKSQVNSELFQQIEIAIDPIANDAKRIQNMMDSINNHQDFKKTGKKFNQWITKAERWVKLDSKLNLQVSVIEAIIEQNFVDSTDRIDQDLKVIADYKAHLLQNLAVSPEEKESLKLFINEKLTIHTVELKKLKEKPESLDIHKIAKWKDKVDQQRSHHFENALHKIDAIIEQMSPVIDESDDSDDELNALEVEAKIIEKDALSMIFNTSQKRGSDKEKTSLLSRFQWLQQKTHQQHLDLQLPAEKSEQLGKISTMLDRIHSKMSEHSQN